MTEAKHMPIAKRWERDRLRTLRLLAGLAHLVEEANEYDLQRVVWDIEEWELLLGSARAALARRGADEAVREKIAKLQEVTLANGSAPAEVAKARERIAKLQAELDADAEGRR